MNTTRAFPWGKIITRFSYDFDGSTFEVTKFFPHKFVNGHQVFDEHKKRVFEDTPSFNNEELHESSHTLDALLVSFIARKHLGTNQSSLVAGIVRALSIPETQA